MPENCNFQRNQTTVNQLFTTDKVITAIFVDMLVILSNNYFDRFK